jgi:hypothetical protein
MKLNRFMAVHWKKVFAFLVVGITVSHSYNYMQFIIYGGY